jgi:hypothetical protein
MLVPLLIGHILTRKNRFFECHYLTTYDMLSFILRLSNYSLPQSDPTSSNRQYEESTVSCISLLYLHSVPGLQFINSLYNTNLI